MTIVSVIEKFVVQDIFSKSKLVTVFIFYFLGAILGPFTGRKLHIDEVKDTNAKKPLWEVCQTHVKIMQRVAVTFMEVKMIIKFFLEF